jgi:hypothetical protein
MKNVVDAFSMYAIEECLLVPMSDIFTPMHVTKLDDATVNRIAAEPEDSIIQRNDLEKKLKVLETTMDTLQRFKAIRSSGKLSKGSRA